MISPSLFLRKSGITDGERILQRVKKAVCAQHPFATSFRTFLDPGVSAVFSIQGRRMHSRSGSLTQSRATGTPLLIGCRRMGRPYSRGRIQRPSRLFRTNPITLNSRLARAYYPQFSGPALSAPILRPSLFLKKKKKNFPFSADTGTTSILNGLITGPGSLTMTGRGTVTLTGANIYSGGTNINGENVQNNFIGIVAVNSDSNLGTGPISFDGGTLEVLATGGGITSNKAIALSPSGGTFQADAGTTSTLSGAISDQGSLSSSSGTLRKSGPGTLILSGVNTYGGVTVVQGGTLKAGSSTAF